jgi:predicted RNase H-like HicB family nuclease
LTDYHINVFYSEEDGCYVADTPDLEACSTFGRTPEEALAEVLEAKETWLAVAREEGRPIPAPQYRPVLYSGWTVAGSQRLGGCGSDRNH